MPEVEIKGTGGASKYEIDFGGPLSGTRSLESSDVQTIDDKTKYLGEVIGGSDYYTGPYPVTVKNLDQTAFGSPPDIIVRIDGTRKRISGGESAEFTDSSSDSPTVGAGGLCTAESVPKTNDDKNNNNSKDKSKDKNNGGGVSMPSNNKILIGSAIVGLGIIASKKRGGGR